MEVGRDGGIAPGVALTVGEEEVWGASRPAAEGSVGTGDVGRWRVGEGTREPVCALALMGGEDC